MAEHMQLRDMPKFCAEIEAWLNARYGEAEGKKRAARYHFTQCPNAEFAKKHDLMQVLPLFCNSDYWGMSQLHGTLLRRGTCGNAGRCDYCVVGSENSMAEEYEIIKEEAGFLASRKIEK